nr:6-phosphogluconate dehydrogenase, C-terminal-like protein [Tanacetum cinerariifolium]
VFIDGQETPGGQKAIQTLKAVYAHWVSEENIITINLWSAELLKLAANAFLAQRISSVNAMSALCEVTGAHVTEVACAVGNGVLETSHQDQRLPKVSLREPCCSLYVSNKKIAILGFAFKKDTCDTRETLAIDVCKGLLGDKACVSIYDPQVTEDQIQRDLTLNKFDWDHPLHLQPMSPTAKKQMTWVFFRDCCMM